MDESLNSYKRYGRFSGRNYIKTGLFLKEFASVFR